MLKTFISYACTREEEEKKEKRIKSINQPANYKTNFKKEREAVIHTHAPHPNYSLKSCRLLAEKIKA